MGDCGSKASVGASSSSEKISCADSFLMNVSICCSKFVCEAVGPLMGMSFTLE